VVLHDVMPFCFECAFIGRRLARIEIVFLREERSRPAILSDVDVSET
jgi:hypothetical protein